MSIASSIGHSIAGSTDISTRAYTGTVSAVVTLSTVVVLSAMAYIGNAGAVCGGTSTVTRTDEIVFTVVHPGAVGGGSSGVRQHPRIVTGGDALGFRGGGESSFVYQYRWIRFQEAVGGALVGGQSGVLVQSFKVSDQGGVAGGGCYVTITSARTTRIGVIAGGSVVNFASTPLFGSCGAVAAPSSEITGLRQAFHVSEMVAGVTGGSAIELIFYLLPSSNIWTFVVEPTVFYMEDV